MSKIDELFENASVPAGKKRVTFFLPIETYDKFRIACDNMGLEYSRVATVLLEEFVVREKAHRTAEDAAQLVTPGGRVSDGPHTWPGGQPKEASNERLPLSTTRGDAGVKRRWTKKKQD